MLEDWKTERFIRKTLRQVARQRVVASAPGGAWVVRSDVLSDAQTQAALRTCHLRGWLEVEPQGVSSRWLSKEGQLPPKEGVRYAEPVYRLTGAGWNVLDRIHGWVVATAVIASVTLVAAVASLLVAAVR
jgi:hypothetical protein